jgi:hypothetical protein
VGKVSLPARDRRRQRQGFCGEIIFCFACIRSNATREYAGGDQFPPPRSEESTVTKLTRRSFLQQTPVSAATLSLLPAVPALAASRRAPKTAAPPLSSASRGSIVIHVKDVASGEMTLFAGTREIALRDPGLVARFVEAAS